MPHRLVPFVTTVSTIVEGAILGIITLVNGILFVAEVDATDSRSGINEEDWNRLTGPHAAVFILALGLLVVWGTLTYTNRERRRDDQARNTRDERRREQELAQRDQHHKEVMEMQRDNSLKIFKLQEKAAEREVKAYEAMAAVGQGMRDMAEELSKRPCQCLTFRYQEQDEAGVEEETDQTSNP